MRKQLRLYQSRRELFFYILMWAIGSPPLLVVAGFISLSAAAYDTLNHPDRHGSAQGFWVRIARILYYSHQAQIWQTKRECVRYNEELLYVPSEGCSFWNTEFSTQMTFSGEGRLIDTNTEKSGNPILILGDSGTMGWGVNDNETYSYLLALRTRRPVFNLAVASYGTARELLRAMRHPSFGSSECIVIQYHDNDLEENETFLTSHGLPLPTPDRFDSLLNRNPTKLSFLHVAAATFQYIATHPVYVWADFIRLFPVPSFNSFATRIIENEDRRLSDVQRHADIFVSVLNRFPELTGKTVFVIAGAGISEEFASKLTLRADPRATVIPLVVVIGQSSLYFLDTHPNKFGHTELATQIVQQMEEREEGRACLGRE